MIFPLHTPARRIVFALVLSALVHGLLLLPEINLPRFEPQLPRLQAKLEPLPNIATQTAAKKRKPKPATLPAPPANLPAPLAASAVALAEPPAPAVADTESTTIASEPAAPPPAVTHPLLPKHAQLSFAVRNSADGFQVGEMHHQLEILDRRYTIKSATQTTGLARLLKSYNLNQTSNGTISANGLRPDNFTEEKNDNGDIETFSAQFDWEARKLSFSEEDESALVENAQDALSILYQLSQLPMRGELFQVSISNGKKLETYALEILEKETITTALGNIPTVHLRKIHAPGESGMEIWLGLEYRLLPVKIQYLEPDGSVTASITITDIRVADE